MTEELVHLPEGWVWTTVGEIYDIIGGGTPTTKVPEYWKGDIPWITSANIHGLKDIRPKKQITREAIANSATNLVHEGSLIVVTRVGLGKIALTDTPICFSQDSQALIGNNKILYPDYSLYFLSQAVQVFKYRHRGTTIAGVTKKQLFELPYALPPFPEQHRIVAKIEELFTRLDAGVEALKKVKAELKRYRQSVLKAAVEGKLTEEWREEHKRELEPASVLLERVKEERKEKLGKKYKELPPVDTSELPELPEGWVWIKLGEILEEIDKVQPKNNPDKEFIYLDIASIDNIQQKITSPKRYLGKDAPSRARQLVKADDILFSTVRTYLKNIAMVDEEYNHQIASTGFCVIRPYEPIYSKLLFHYVQTDDFLNPLNQIQRGTSYPAVRNSDVYAQNVPLSSKGEQHKIVEEIDRRLSVADNMERVVEENIKRAERLRQSILKRAFEGKLVPQDPSDEPASVLLERIKAEKAKREADTNAGKRKRKVHKAVQRRSG